LRIRELKRKLSGKNKERRKREHMAETGACIGRPSFLSLMTFPLSEAL